ncbi:MAG: ABC transporter permease [Granulosicoccus sp.]
MLAKVESGKLSFVVSSLSWNNRGLVVVLAQGPVVLSNRLIMAQTSTLAGTVSPNPTVATGETEKTERPVVVIDPPTDTADLKSIATAPVSSVAELNSRVFRLPSFNLTELVQKIKSDHAQPVTIALLSLSVGVFVWYLASEFNVNWFINFENVPGPGSVFMAFIGHLQTEIFYTHIGVSLRRILISYSLAVVLGICIGVLMGRSRLVKQFVMPYIEVVRPIPAVAWIPLAILMWPTEESSIIYITFLGALFPIVLNTLHGVEQTPEVLVRASQSLGASRWGIFRHVVLPGALPSIAAGLAIGMGVSWFSLLAGEIISGQYGIGYFTWNAYSLINYQDIVVGMLVIGFLGTGCTLAIKLITRPMLHWQKRTR